ncbi:MAG TPA: DNA polymerase III subunit gamma/tau [Anaerolineae bacterium]|nr:DNA polymerase III subunit gamma/tau [Anaerolineae bacterium]
MPQAYYRKWRPANWDEVVGQDHVIRTLRNAVQQDKIVHAYLFAGPRGTGKTTTARILAKAVNCLTEDLKDRPCNKCQHCQDITTGRFLDLIEIDAASNTSVDDVRDLREKINFSPSNGRYKVYIIDEVHMLSNAAFNALLKTLEEPPAHAIFVLATTEIHKIPATVLSRCQRHEFRRIPINFITAQLKQIKDQEKLAVEPEALTLIARQATGSMRDAISLLDQLASTGEKVTLELAQTVLGAATSESVFKIVDTLQAKKAGEGVTVIHKALDSGTDPRQYARQIVDYLRALMMVKLGNKAEIETTQEVKNRMIAHARGFSMPLLLSMIRLFNRAATTSRAGWQPALQLELAIAEAVGLRHSTREVDSSKSHQPEQHKKKGEKRSFGNRQLRKNEPGKAKTTARSGETVEKLEKFFPSPNKLRKKTEQASQSNIPKQESNSQDDLAEKRSHLSKILDNWQEIRAEVKRRLPKTEALLNSCKTTTMERGTLVLGFASDLLKSKMESDENIALTKSAIKAIIDLEVPIVCRVVNPNVKSVPPDLNIDGDGMVSTALSLGGKIVDKE